MTRRCLPGVFVFLGLLPAGAEAAPKIVGYATSWSGAAAAVPMARLTHVNYAFVVPFADGSVEPVPNPDKLTILVSAAHEQGKKVLISVGGWNDGDDSGFEALSASAPARANFVSHMSTLVGAYQLDGVDIDWEFPDLPGLDRFGVLMQELCAALHAQGKLCTAAVPAAGYYGAAIPADVFGAVDFLNLMAYDGGEAAEHSPYSYAVAALDYWLGRGLPPEKAVLGVPFYGRPSWESYADIVARDPEAPTRDLSNGVHYNGRDTIAAKAQLAKERAGGIMIWELAQDTADEQTSLLAVIWGVLGPNVFTDSLSPPAAQSPRAPGGPPNAPTSGRD